MDHQRLKLKRLLKNLDKSRGIGTSVVSLLMPPGTQVHKISQMLTEEIGTAENIKSRVNRQAVLTAIASAQTKLKQFNSCPSNGLAIYAGEVADATGKPKKVTYAIEPFRPLNTSLYRCDDRFHTDALL